MSGITPTLPSPSKGPSKGEGFVTVALAGQAPTGTTLFTKNAHFVTPSLMAGKGFGQFNVQAATSIAVPTALQNTLGPPGQPIRRFNITLETCSGRSSRPIGRTGSMGHSVAARISSFPPLEPLQARFR
jgi:hypothetical protein